MKDISQQKIAEMAFTLLVQLCKASNEDIIVSAFDSLESYTEYKKKKRLGGFRTISVPPKELKTVQKKLLGVLNKLEKRSCFYLTKHPFFSNQVFYKPGLKSFIDPRLYGSIKGKSVTSAARVHTFSNSNFLIELDIKNAFPSVKRNTVFEVLKKIIICEFKTYFETYKADKFIYKKFARGSRRRNTRYNNRPRYNPLYIRFPLFSNRDCYAFRSFVRSQAHKYEFFEDTRLEDIASNLAHLMTDLVTKDGSLPQGSPTSGMILNLIISDKILPFLKLGFNHCLSIYVDNILISSDKKPDQEMIDKIISQFEKDDLFKINTDKTCVYDLRNQSGHILGIKIVKRPARVDELAQMRWNNYKNAPPGLKKNDKHGLTESWQKTHLTLCKKTQKLYRAKLHNCIVNEVDEDTLSKAHGYIGHLVSIYGWPYTHMPSCLSKVVDLFRKKYKIYEK